MTSTPEKHKPGMSSTGDDSPPALINRSSTDSSNTAPRTPTNLKPTKSTLADVFPAEDPDCPSPPQKNRDMEISEVHERMRSLLLFITPERLKKNHPDEYQRLCYVIGQDLDKQFPWGRGYFYTCQLLLKKGKVSERFEALYKANGDLTTAENEDKNETFASYMSRIPGYESGTENSFTIFDSPVHANLQPFYRYQLSGNCFLHAPILMLWYLALWYDKTKDASDVQLIHLSRYARNMFDSEKLYNYLFSDSGGESFDELLHMTKHTSSAGVLRALFFIPYTSSYETICKLLQAHGPALVEADCVPLMDFRDDRDKLHYEKFPDVAANNIKTVGGHAMLLVGIRKDEYGQIFFLLQNWWKGKQFLEVRNDYLSSMGGSRHNFQFITRPIELAEDSVLYVERTGAARRAQSSPLLERQYRHMAVPQR